MPTDDPSKIIRDRPRKKGEYHGYGPDGYKPGPYHGTRSNLDQVAMVKADLEKRSGKAGAK